MANQTAAYKMQDGRYGLDFDTSATLDDTQSGLVVNVIKDGLTLTLPATVVGYTYVIRNGGVPVTSGTAGSGSDASLAVVIAPNASDKIAGNKFTATDNKAMTNTKATAAVGDEVQLFGDGVNGWFCQRVRGIWARAA